MADRLRYPELAPEGYAALSGFGHYINTATSLTAVLRGLVYLRASVLNGCHYCIEMHSAELRKHHEPETRIAATVSGSGWEVFTPREQAALRWTEILTQLTAEGVSDAEYQAVQRFFDGKELVDLSYAIASINAWNRMGLAFQPKWRTDSSGDKSAPERQHAATTSATDQPSGQPGEGSAVVADDGGGDDDGGKVALD